MEMANLLLLLFGVLMQSQVTIISCQKNEFDRERLGIVFSPYVREKENGFEVARTEYTYDEVEIMLQLVSTKFKWMATYGMGVTSTELTNSTDPCTGSNTICYTTLAAADLNQQRNNLSLTVLTGAFHTTTEIFAKEIEKAFEVSLNANKIYPGTAIGVIFSSSYVTGTSQANEIEDSMKQYLPIAKTNNLTIGIRTNQCQDFSQYNNSVAYKVLLLSDFIICTINPELSLAANGMENVIDDVSNKFSAIQKWIGDIKPTVTIYAETVWASEGSEWNSIDNMESYWNGINKWAVENKVVVFMAEAIDNPWKRWSTTASHEGWWTLKANNDTSFDGYLQKVDGPRPKQPEKNKVTTSAISQNSKSDLVLAMAIGIPLTLIFIVASVYVAYSIRKRSLKVERLTEKEILEFEQGANNEEYGDENGISALKLPYDRKYEISRDKFIIDRNAVLGSGAFGVVYKGKMEGERFFLAFKTTKANCPATALKGILSEIKVLIYLGKHENIVNLYGAYTGELRKGIVFVAYEFCSLGSLEHYLRSKRSDYEHIDEDTNENNASRYANLLPMKEAEEKDTKEDSTPFTLIDLLKWSYEIAAGMEFVSSKNVIHADLATRNVLLTFDGTAKISDFGLSRRLYEYTNYVKTQQEPLPWRWMAIESLRHLDFSSKSDVWSFGITIWEIFSFGELPYAGMHWSVEFVKLLEEGLRLRKPTQASSAIYKEMEKTWFPQPADRPNFTHYKEFFRNQLEIMCNGYENISVPDSIA